MTVSAPGDDQRDTGPDYLSQTLHSQHLHEYESIIPIHTDGHMTC